ncbi:MAG TPA: endonuclease III [Kofleriaceae bacterium]
MAAIAARLAELWPDAVVELDHENAYQLLVATILAAQSTDKLVNTVTPALFAKYPDPAALARADQAELEPMIFSTGFYRMKARHLLGMARRIVEHHGGQVPDTMAGLIDLPGVARKTANVVLGSALGKNEGIVVDTHVSRVAPRLGLTRQTEPVKIEQDLMQLVPRDQWSIFAHRLIWHGRRICHARQPDCEHCALAPLCPSAGLVATPELMPPRNGKPPPPSRAERARAAKAKATEPAAPKPAGRDRSKAAQLASAVKVRAAGLARSVMAKAAGIAKAIRAESTGRAKPAGAAPTSRAKPVGAAPNGRAKSFGTDPTARSKVSRAAPMGGAKSAGPEPTGRSKSFGAELAGRANSVGAAPTSRAKSVGAAPPSRANAVGAKASQLARPARPAGTRSIAGRPSSGRPDGSRSTREKRS